MRKLLVHPIPTLLLLFLVSVGVQPTSPVVEAPDVAGVAATTLNDDGDVQGDPCNVTCLNFVCQPGQHKALQGAPGLDEFDGGPHDWCVRKWCAWFDSRNGKHPPCGGNLAAAGPISEAIAQGQLDQLVEVLAANEAVVLNTTRRAIQVWSECVEDQLDAHLPLTIEFFDALVLAQQQ